MMRQTIQTNDAPGAIGPYVQAVKCGDFLFTSGQLGIDAQSGQLADGVEAQAHAALKNLGAILRASGSDYAKALKTTMFVTDMGDFSRVNEIYQSYFDGVYPARSCVEVAALPMGARIEIECIALVD